MTKCVLRLIMGLEIGSKSFFRPKSRPKTPESINRKPMDIDSWSYKPHSRHVFPEIGGFFWSAFCTPQDRLDPTSTPGFRLIFFVLNRGARFVHCGIIQFTILNIPAIFDVSRTHSQPHFVTHGQDLKLEIL